MTENKVDMYMMSNSSYFPGNRLLYIRQKLTDADDNKWAQVNTLSYKNPIVVTLVSVFGGCIGADRYYLGHPVLGTCKLILWVALIVWACIINIKGDDASLAVVLAFLPLSFIIGIWCIADIFLTGKAAKKQNLNKLLTILH